MYIWLVVGLGGFIGAVLRYYMSGFFQSRIIAGFPSGTLAVNFLGSFFLSVAMYLSEFFGVFDRESRIFLTIGVLGSFTTMSTFSYEAFRMMEQGEIILMLGYVMGTVLLCFLGIYFGKMLALSLWRV